jgi:DNA excision repair protein ERCC-5
MGVHGLWQLLSPAARAVSLAHIRDKRVAVDISVWLHQFVHGIMVHDTYEDEMSEDSQKMHHQLYLIALFHRICKLLFFGVKPVFVFDGQTPLIKKQTVVCSLIFNVNKF